MKPWLFDILACPIDKYYPLELKIFSYETSNESIQSMLDTFINRDMKVIDQKEIILISEENGKTLIKDNIILEFTEFGKYIEKILSSIEEFDHVEDRSSNELAKKCFELSKTTIKEKLKEVSRNMTKEEINCVLPELFFINQLKLEVEIETGLLFCKECNRWYPIVETIPQMLPDQYRDKEKDIKFLEENKKLIEKDLLLVDLKPFNLTH